MKARESDYATLGIQVILILHKRLFSAVQQHLEYLPRYFTNNVWLAPLQTPFSHPA